VAFPLNRPEPGDIPLPLAPAPRWHADDDWLSIGPASRRLGVDADTLRRWADEGRIRSFATPGGHRRFSSRDVARLQEVRRRPHRSLATLGATSDQVSRAYARSYRSSDPLDAAQAVGAADRETFRAEGRQLVGTLLRFLDAPAGAARSELEAEAAETVARTARRLAAAHISLTQAIEAFVAARGPLLQALEAISRREVLPARRMTELYAEAAAILDRLLLGFIAAFQQAMED
jgi:excisionase family DNA binding protein